MCDNLFGQTFKFSNDSGNCLDPFSPSHNVEIIQTRFPGKETSVCEKNSEFVVVNVVVLAVAVVVGF